VAKLCSSVLPALVGITLLGPSPALAGSVYLDIPGITGEDPVSGYPDAMAVKSFTVSHHAFSIVKEVDKASPQILLDVATGKFLPKATALFYYKSPSTGPADATLTFKNVVASSYQSLGGLDSVPLERDSFAAAGLSVMYLKVPGDSKLVQIDSFTVAGYNLSVVKHSDATAPKIGPGSIPAGDPENVSLLIYDSTPTGPPSATLIFQNATPQGQDSFDFTNIVSPSATPEPSSLALLGMAMATIDGYLGGRQRKKTTSVGA
jgi:hypothetical protein